jgi:hypothetical protein
MNIKADVGNSGVFNQANEAATLSFGKLLDFIGLDCYSAMPRSIADPLGTPTLSEAIGAWDNTSGIGYSHLDIMRGLSEKFNKPLFFVENNWGSQSLSNLYGTKNLAPNYEAQVIQYSAQFQTVMTHLKDIVGGWLIGGESPQIEIQNTPYLLNGYSNPDGSYGLSNEQGGTMAGKPAQATIASYFSGAALNAGLNINMSATTPYGFGYNGNDTFNMLSGSHTVDGGAGSDTVQYQNVRSAASVTLNNGTITVSKADRTDTITRVERIDFTDGDLVFDVASSLAPAAYRLYGGAFDRTPDEGGFRFWTSTLDKNASLHAVANEFISSPEFVSRYGASLSNAAFVDALYQNVLHRGGDTGGIAYWNQQLDTKARDRPDVLVQFTQLPEFVGISAANTTNGYWVV